MKSAKTKSSQRRVASRAVQQGGAKATGAPGQGSPNDFILYRSEPPLAWITLNRPAKKNALAGSMREDLLSRIQQAASDASVRCLILTGAGDAFCSGGDISVMAELKQKDAGFQEIARWLDAGGKIVTALANLPKPSLACVNGVAAGAGCNLALACDFRIASQSASLGETFSRVGLHPDWGGTYFLPRLVGWSKALEMFATGEMIDAEQALRFGLVNRVVPAGKLEEETRAFARRLCVAPPLSFLAAREAVRRSCSTSLSAMLIYERH
ncbi:MAG: enoyl-CoA hydratase/isomerase family protein, partial [Acidobacteria bacterium]|nr:enoyl-CoA hydratase/isomerase family protein [Acidobacteriota bacterium]